LSTPPENNSRFFCVPRAVDERVKQGGEPVTEAEQNAAVLPGKPETLSARVMAKPPKSV